MQAGHREARQAEAGGPPRVRMPRTITTVRRTQRNDAGAPARYQRRSAVHRGRSCRPAGKTGEDLAGRGHQPGGSARSAAQPGDGGVAAHDRRRSSRRWPARQVGAATVTVRHDDVGRSAGARVERRGACLPAAGASAALWCSTWQGRSGRQAHRDSGHPAVARARSVLHQDRPAALRGNARGGDVAAQADQHADAERGAISAAARSAAHAFAVAPRSSLTPAGEPYRSAPRPGRARPGTRCRPSPDRPAAGLGVGGSSAKSAGGSQPYDVVDPSVGSTAPSRRSGRLEGRPRWPRSGGG